ncbi:MAG: aldo/keto reductase [Chloroflexi bacterium]|nr:aldo/keto reductase [Chloroflexota bacterium]
MEYRALGRSGVKVAPLGLGTGNFADPTSEEESIAILQRALEAGINLIDTANSYTNGESERYIGRAFAKGLPRHDVILATKAFQRVGPGPNDEDLSRLHLILL